MRNRNSEVKSNHPMAHSDVQTKSAARTSAGGDQPRAESDFQVTLKLFIAGFARFFLLVFKTYFRSRGTFARLSLKRFILVSGTIPLLFVSQLIHWVGLLLDEVLFPGFRDVCVKEPVFLVGISRSGTTLTQRVLAKDTDNFTGVTLWEETFAPSIIEWKFWTALGKLDKLLWGPGHALLRVIDRYFFRAISKIHPAGLFLHEEDELLLLPIFATIALIYPFPFTEDLLRLFRFDMEVSEAEQERIMRFYRSCIQRHLYVHGPEKHYLAKNTLSTTKIRAIRKMFPDAKIICNVRCPYDAVPSTMSLAAFYWRQFDNGTDPITFRNLVMDAVYDMYVHPIETLPDWPEDQYIFVRYEDLKPDMPTSIAGIYERFQFELTDKFAAILARKQEESKTFESKHTYSMGEYALAPELICDYFGRVFEYFNFRTDYDS